MQMNQLQQPRPSVVPEQLITILKSCQSNNGSNHFPQTEIFNEGWMLRLVLDAFQELKIQNHPLTFIDEKAHWYSEARLLSPFRRKPKKDIPGTEKDTLGEGYTCADGVIGHFTFRDGAKAGIQLANKPCQFIVVEAKLNSHLSAGVTHAMEYNQAARNVACMAEMMRVRGVSVRDLDSVGFYVLAPGDKLQLRGKKDIATYLAKPTIRKAIEDRMAIYKKAGRYDNALRAWEKTFDEVLDHMIIQPISWEDVIERISNTQTGTGSILNDFYQACRVHARFQQRS